MDKNNTSADICLFYIMPAGLYVGLEIIIRYMFFSSVQGIVEFVISL